MTTLREAFQEAYTAGLNTTPIDEDRLAALALGPLAAAPSGDKTLGEILAQSLLAEWASGVTGRGSWSTDPQGPPGVWLVLGHEEDPDEEVWDTVLCHSAEEALRATSAPSQWGARLLQAPEAVPAPLDFNPAFPPPYHVPPVQFTVEKARPHIEEALEDLNDLLRIVGLSARLAEEPFQGFPKEAAARLIETVGDVADVRIEAVRAVLGVEANDGRALVMVHGFCSDTGPDSDRPFKAVVAGHDEPFAAVMTADGLSVVGPVY